MLKQTKEESQQRPAQPNDTNQSQLAICMRHGDQALLWAEAGGCIVWSQHLESASVDNLGMQTDKKLFSGLEVCLFFRGPCKMVMFLLASLEHHPQKG